MKLQKNIIPEMRNFLNNLVAEISNLMDSILHTLIQKYTTL